MLRTLKDSLLVPDREPVPSLRATRRERRRMILGLAYPEAGSTLRFGSHWSIFRLGRGLSLKPFSQWALQRPLHTGPWSRSLKVMPLKAIFKVEKPIIGMLHLPALPGSPANRLDLNA